MFEQSRLEDITRIAIVIGVLTYCAFLVAGLFREAGWILVFLLVVLCGLLLLAGISLWRAQHIERKRENERKSQVIHSNINSLRERDGI